MDHRSDGSSFSVGGDSLYGSLGVFRGEGPTQGREKNISSSLSIDASIVLLA